MTHTHLGALRMPAATRSAERGLDQVLLQPQAPALPAPRLLASEYISVV